MMKNTMTFGINGPPFSSQEGSHSKKWLRRFSKFICVSTLFLIFAGGMVTSTDSGLAVPDWPLSYGTFFPPMVGGVFYEHGHRVIASFVGLLTLILSIWLGIKEKRRWVRYLGYCALGAVVLQGILGGMTVIFLLPTPVSVAHATLAQTFFILIIIIAYSQSKEYQLRIDLNERANPGFLRASFLVIGLVYLQLILGAIMRHTGSGLAVPDFPTMGGEWWPNVNDEFIARINSWRFDYNLDPINIVNIIFHLTHRAGAFLIFLAVCFLNYHCIKQNLSNKILIKRTVLYLNLLIIIQITLGILALATLKAPIVTSIHVATGASILGVLVLLILRCVPAALSCKITLN